MGAGSGATGRRVFAASALPGIAIAGLFVGIGRHDIAMGLFLGAVVGAVSLWLLTGSVDLFAGPDEEHRRNKWYIAAWLMKYAVIAAVLFIAFTYFEADPVGMCAGYTIALVGFLIASVAAMNDSDRQDQ